MGGTGGGCAGGVAASTAAGAGELAVESVLTVKRSLVSAGIPPPSRAVGRFVTVNTSSSLFKSMWFLSGISTDSVLRPI